MKFDEWYKENEVRFYQGQFTEKEVARSAWNTSRNQLLGKIRMLIAKVNRVTSCHRHKTPITKTALDNLSNYQIEVEDFIKEAEEK